MQNYKNKIKKRRKKGKNDKLDKTQN